MQPRPQDGQGGEPDAAGRSLLAPAELESAGILAAYALTDLEPDLTRCMTEAGPLLERLAERVASDWVTDDARR